ncbi:hypothetical protein GCM10027294_43640 [Marinactinospora endophytica]
MSKAEDSSPEKPRRRISDYKNRSGEEIPKEFPKAADFASQILKDASKSWMPGNPLSDDSQDNHHKSDSPITPISPLFPFYPLERPESLISDEDMEGVAQAAEERREAARAQIQIREETKKRNALLEKQNQMLTKQNQTLNKQWWAMFLLTIVSALGTLGQVILQLIG